MTAVMEDQQVVESDDSTQTDGRKSRDFSKFTEKHQELADYINSHPDVVSAGIPAITPNQVKAAFALRGEFNDTPEVKAAREERRKQREEEKKQFAGMTPEEIKAEKAAKRAEAQAAKLEARVKEALAKAQAIREGKDASGEDVAAAVEAKQDDSKRKIGRRR